MSRIQENQMTVLGRVTAASTEKVDPLSQPDAPYVGLEHIERDLGTINGQGTAAEVRSTKAVFRKGDLLYGKLRPYLNKVWVAQFDGVCSTDILVFPKNESADSSFLKYRFMTRDFVNFAAENSNGVNLPRVNAKALARFPIWIPEVDKQRRIVAEIEKQFTRLDAGIAALRRTQANLKRYRAAVLNAACEGRLVPTEAQIARDENRAFESAEILLHRIREQKAALVRKGELRKARKSERAFSPPSQGKIPEGWEWGAIADFGALEENAIVDGPFGSNLKLTDYEPNGTCPVITITNINEGFDLTALRKVSAKKFDELKRSAIRPGDILVAKIGSSYGKTGIYPFHMPVGLIPANLLKITPSREMDWKYLYYHLKSLSFKTRLDPIVQFTAQPAFNVSKFKLLPIPVPPLAEQSRIAAEVERRLSVVEELETVVKANLQRANRLRQSVLQKAFTGEQH